jgi:hypothetical protein
MLIGGFSEGRGDMKDLPDDRRRNIENSRLNMTRVIRYLLIRDGNGCLGAPAL